MNQRGFSAIGLMSVAVIAGLILSIAIPSFGSMRMSKSFRSGEQAVQAMLEHARSSAIASGRPTTRVSIEGSVIRVRAGTAEDAPIVTQVDATDYSLSLAGTNLPADLDARGMRVGDTAPTLTISNPRISAARTFTVGPRGEAASS